MRRLALLLLLLTLAACSAERPQAAWPIYMLGCQMGDGGMVCIARPAPKLDAVP